MGYAKQQWEQEGADDITAFGLCVEFGVIERCEQHGEYWDAGPEIDGALEAGMERMAEGDPAYAHFGGDTARLHRELQAVKDSYGTRCAACESQAYRD